MSEQPGGVVGGEDWEDLAVKVIRGLAMDGPHKANSGHPGTAMALAPLAHVLFSRVMKYDPSDPKWADRDRFILSCGHVSILLYSMLHLTGYELSLDDLKEFRQLSSKTPGHPENEITPGVEVTTGPLGQGFANAVGMAVAERHLRSTFGEDLCDHTIWAIAGDGCLEEGISHEAASLAGHLGLGRLVCVYDDNHITIDGPTELALNDHAPDRFRAYNWHVIELGEQHPHPANGCCRGPEPVIVQGHRCRGKSLHDRLRVGIVFEPLDHPEPLDALGRQEPSPVFEGHRHLDSDKGPHFGPAIAPSDLGACGDQHRPELSIVFEDVIDEGPIARFKDVQRQLGVREDDRGQGEHRDLDGVGRHQVRLEARPRFCAGGERLEGVGAPRDQSSSGCRASTIRRMPSRQGTFVVPTSEWRRVRSTITESMVWSVGSNSTARPVSSPM